MFAESIAKKQERIKAYTDIRRRSRNMMVKPGKWIKMERPTREHKQAIVEHET